MLALRCPTREATGDGRRRKVRERTPKKQDPISADAERSLLQLQTPKPNPTTASGLLLPWPSQSRSLRTLAGRLQGAWPQSFRELLLLTSF